MWVCLTADRNMELRESNKGKSVRILSGLGMEAEMMMPSEAA